MMNATIFENKIDIDVNELVLKPGQEYVFVDAEKYKVSCVMMDHGVPCLGYAWIEKDRTRIDMAACEKLGVKEGPMVGKLTRGLPVVVNGTTIKPEDVIYCVAGKKIAFIPDTQFTQDLALLAHHADLLICESTYISKEEEKSRDVRHMTAEHAAHVATKAEVGRLILTHFSPRYTSTREHVDEARAIFPKTDAAFDLMKITL